MNNVDIVIPIHKAGDYFEQCIDNLFANTGGANYRLILVDDFSQDPKVDAVIARCQRERHTTMVIKTSYQKWFTRASNHGLRLVKTSHAVLLNSDTIPRQGWLEELLSVKEELEKQGYIPAVIGSVWSAGETRRYADTKEPDYVTGHCWFCYMQAFEDVAQKRGTPGYYFNQFDQNQVHINGDRILCYELNKAGYETIMAFKSQVDHYGGKSWNHDLGRLEHEAPKIMRAE